MSAALPVDARRFVERLLSAQGSVVELRALGVHGVRGRGTLSGYFDDVDALLAAAANLDGRAKGIHVTLNPIDRALLGRANNRTKVPENATSDADVLARSWLLIDVDPTRPSGISSSDAEKEAAREVMQEVGRFLRELGFPDPIVADSGNGWHLLYRIDLPGDDGGLVQRALQALAFRFDSDVATVDQAVHNPSRLTKLYGTQARKGDETPERPHRRSRLVSVPTELGVADRGLLERLARLAPTATAPAGSTGDAFDVDGFLREHGLDVLRVGPWNGGTRWVLETCPFDESHTDGAAYVVQFSNGAVAAGCHHAGCSGRTWADLREKHDPQWRGRQGASVSCVSAPPGHSRTDPWPEPQPLPTELPEVAPFTAEYLPGVARRFVTDVAERLQCPIDFPAVGLLIVLATVVGRLLGIRPKRHDDWTVVTNLWGMIVGRPSIMKTPALRHPLGLLGAIEREGKLAHDEALAEHAARLLVWEAQKRKLGELDLIGAREFLEQKPAPPLRARYVLNDATVEKLGEILQDNPNGVLLFRDELTGFLRSLEKENQQHARAFYLEAWDGSGSFTYDRIGRGTVDIPSATVSMLGGIQPGPLTTYYTSAVRGGAGDDGLLQRFQLAVWPDVSPHWVNVDRLPDTDARAALLDVLRELRGRDAQAYGAARDPNDPTGVPFLHFTPEAQEVFDGWRAGLEMRLRGGEEHPAVESHLAKYRSLIPSLALLFHLVDDGHGPVTFASLERAISVGGYLETHARRLYSVALNADVPAAKALLAKIRSGQVKDGFCSRDIYRRGWTGLQRDDVERAVGLLVDYDWLRAVREPTGGAPKTVYLINPRAHETARGGTDTTDKSPSVSSGSTGSEASSSGADARPASTERVSVDPETERDLGWAS